MPCELSHATPRQCNELQVIYFCEPHTPPQNLDACLTRQLLLSGVPNVAPSRCVQEGSGFAQLGF